jgi:hypothetical protein
MLKRLLPACLPAPGSPAPNLGVRVSRACPSTFGVLCGVLGLSWFYQGTLVPGRGFGGCHLLRPLELLSVLFSLFSIRRIPPSFLFVSRKRMEPSIMLSSLFIIKHPDFSRIIRSSFVPQERISSPFKSFLSAFIRGEFLPRSQTTLPFTPGKRVQCHAGKFINWMAYG